MSCTFCKIINKQQTANVHFENDSLIIFDDIKPAAKYHFLVCPKTHVGNAKSLSPDQKPMIEELVSEGKRLLEEKGVDVTASVMGFHWPPFNSIKHLHLHVIAPSSDMGFLGRMIFKPDSFWFVTPEYVLNRLSKL